MIVVADPKWNQVCAIDEGHIGVWKFNAQAAGGALEVISFEYEAPERRVTAWLFHFGFVFVAC
jgi:hypothetical protein